MFISVGTQPGIIVETALNQRYLCVGCGLCVCFYSIGRDRVKQKKWLVLKGFQFYVNLLLRKICGRCVNPIVPDMLLLLDV